MALATIARPQPGEHDKAFTRYIERVPGTDLLGNLARHIEETAALLSPLPAERGRFRYEAGKWSVAEVVSHMSDAERIFSYRALRFARGDQTPLASFEEKDYTPMSGADRRGLAEVLAELRLVRQATLALFRGFDEEAWSRSGAADDKSITVRALGYVIAGHERHHVTVLRDRYGLGA